MGASPVNRRPLVERPGSSPSCSGTNWRGERWAEADPVVLTAVTRKPQQPTPEPRQQIEVVGIDDDAALRGCS